MAEFISLYSGSSGNCSVVRCKDAYLLVDMGKGVRVTTGALRELGLDAAGCGGILVTHEHSDHIKGLATFLKRHPLPVYGAEATLQALEASGTVPAAVRDNTAALVRALMERYAVPPERVLRHYDVTGKRCPAPWVDNPAEWMEFKKMLEGDDDMSYEQFEQYMDRYLSERNAKPADDWAKPYIQDAIDAGAMTDVGGSIERPQGFITRQEMAVVAAALSKK